MMRPSRATEIAHVERLLRKQQRLEMLRALIVTWENQPVKDPEYIKELYRKSDRLQNQLSVMAI